MKTFTLVFVIVIIIVFVFTFKFNLYNKLNSMSVNTNNLLGEPPYRSPHLDTLWVRNSSQSRTLFLDQQYATQYGTRKRKSNSSSLNNVINLSVSGQLFSGSTIRAKLDLPMNVSRHFVGNFQSNISTTCRNWAVLTTIFGVSESVKQIVESERWCLVVIADDKSISKSRFMQQLKQRTTVTSSVTSSVIYLTPGEQDNLYPALSTGIPRNHYGRKNIGYIFAIHHGADVIWDFDDDNIGILNINITQTTYSTPCYKTNNLLLNPYPYFGVSESYVWPRGFPLQHIKNSTTYPIMCAKNDAIKVGVIQSLANHEPDVDAIFRLTRDSPFNFSKSINTVKPLLVPKNSYVPLNAQASMWFPDAFMFLILPLGVNGRVADIWRGYIAECLLYSNTDNGIMFTPPYIFQNRTAHNFIRDFNAELDLYQKSQQLVTLLSDLQNVVNEVNITYVYMELYIRDYLQRIDVEVIQLWLQTLQAVCRTVNSIFCQENIKY